MPERIPASELREVMDIKEAAEYLGVSHDTMYHYASSAFIPAFKLGNRWRLRRTALNAWMDAQALKHTLIADQKSEERD